MTNEYKKTIDYLYSRLPMFTRIGAAAYKKDLHNTLVLLEALGNPHLSFKSIHIAGTNGKGSTSHMLAAIFHKSGYKTGLYTSPHLYDFRERIKVSDGERLQMVDEDFVVSFTESIKPLIERIEPSFFELTVAMAFAFFAQQKVDIAIIETGLGGRLDSTNVITPELSIITNIGWDHMNLLGDTLEKIAGEKAGIIKPGIPVVIGETFAEILPVFTKKAASCGAFLTLAEKTWEIRETIPNIEHLVIALRNNTMGETLTLTCDLPGMYQQYNIRTVLTAWKILQKQGWNLTETDLAHALQQVKTLTGLGGRWQVIGHKPWVVLDVAHNEAGMQQLVKQISILQKETGIAAVHIIIGMVKDKDIDKVLSLLPAGYQYYFTQAQLPRALPFLDLKEKAATFHLKGNGFSSPQVALEKALSVANPSDLVVVCGSVFVVAEIGFRVSGLRFRV
jgi:dihydrofolate synthase/folylpolyglutamate synthase